MSVSEHFRTMIAMAAADGAMSEAELRLLSDRAVEFGITDDEFEDALQDAIHRKVDISLPADRAERASILKDMIRMMAADGHMRPNEKKLFAVVATLYEFDGDGLNQLIDEVLAEG
ncbi:MAG: TerB family tellurite resistance protein [Planctomycetales bacterium]|nr:TerB family tellurite resistance protein [Planctomycetales bacterium]